MIHLHCSKCQTVINKETFIHQKESEEVIKGKVSKSSFKPKDRDKSIELQFKQAKTRATRITNRITDDEAVKLRAFGEDGV